MCPVTADVDRLDGQRREHNGRTVYSYDPKFEGSNVAPAGSGMEEILINVTELVTSI